ncbi:Mitochondrial distribution and morphology protein 12 [Neolecta irregularis DAH-3]|uniref:Mitochondrial distribution and morphology protein 12 n=1 Tax=Neolecta irregularis (strain DAH-3) TaxID=1198029 RepID=A0A1U7LX57_NEOID|nr:Mitochondrial distribution and morphology protein 12 [Neolecta irregularis DAH-3]|eukprot:OLL27142.1 Mitochondrial distribution and morphology protein 12 [Neolecta irregularis DAH-3]
MAVEFDWTKLDSSVANDIKIMLNSHFASITLPNFLRSIEIIDIDLGSVPPSVFVKDISDPLDDFYEEDYGYEEEGEQESAEDSDRISQTSSKPPPYAETPNDHSFSFFFPQRQPLHYSAFSPHAAGLATGLMTPTLPFSPVFEHCNPIHHIRRRTESSSISNTSELEYSRHVADEPRLSRSIEKKQTHIQVTADVEYKGDIRLSLNAELILNHPAAMFVGLPVRLQITGIHLQGSLCVALIENRIHLCFMEGNVLKDLRIESEIGEQGGHVLKNVGKVEKFVLEQVRRIVEDETVFPSFWTFIM